MINLFKFRTIRYQQKLTSKTTTMTANKPLKTIYPYLGYIPILHILWKNIYAHNDLTYNHKMKTDEVDINSWKSFKFPKEDTLRLFGIHHPLWNMNIYYLTHVYFWSSPMVVNMMNKGFVLGLEHISMIPDHCFFFCLTQQNDAQCNKRYPFHGGIHTIWNVNHLTVIYLSIFLHEYTYLRTIEDQRRLLYPVLPIPTNSKKRRKATLQNASISPPSKSPQIRQVSPLHKHYEG